MNGWEARCANDQEPEMMRPLIKVALYDATSANDCTLLEEDGEYFVNFGNRTGTYREFLRMAGNVSPTAVAAADQGGLPRLGHRRTREKGRTRIHTIIAFSRIGLKLGREDKH